MNTSTRHSIHNTIDQYTHYEEFIVLSNFVICILIITNYAEKCVLTRTKSVYIFFKMTTQRNDQDENTAETRMPVKLEDAVVPVTIKQIIERNGDENQKVSNFSLVARIIDVKDEASYVEYKITDGTGSIVVKEISENPDIYSTEQYLYLVIRSKSKENLILHKKKVEDFNQIPFHFLYALQTHLNSIHGSQSKIVTDESIANEIIGFIRNQKDQTASKSAILSEFQRNYSADQIMKGIEKAISQGEIYDSVNDSYVCVN